jgi:hypothetical protein
LQKVFTVSSAQKLQAKQHTTHGYPELFGHPLIAGYNSFLCQNCLSQKNIRQKACSSPPN